ncbi:MAG: PHP domain-containing protein [Methanolobus sp.]|nr:PHP domain-containing protein [Methanolobus sp.]
MKFDLHVHSCYSKDSNASPDDILKHAARNGLHGFAICDHDTIEGGIACATRAQETGSKQLVIPGVEVSSSKGHILVLGARENIEPGLSPEETIKKARHQGAVVIIPHPFKVTSHGIGYVQGLDTDAVEVLNSRCITDGPNNKARKASLELGLPMVGGSDSHEAEMVGRSYTEIEADHLTIESVLDAIRKGNTRPGGSKTPASFVVRQMLLGHMNKLGRFLGIR